MSTDLTDALWSLGRGSGVVTLVLVSLSLVLGVLSRSGRAILGLPRFAVAAVHRRVALLSVCFVVVHLLTLLLDSYAQLTVLDLAVPFLGAHQAFWLGLGTLDLDLLLAVTLSSLLRATLGRRTWRAIHLSVFALWPIAVLHGIGTGTDSGTPWFLAVVGVCVGGVVSAVLWRLTTAFTDRPSGPAATTRRAPPFFAPMTQRSPR